MIISYFIAEDGDSPDHPNVFVCDQSSLSLGQLKKIFPVPGQYHFRFQKMVGSIPVWMDVVDDNSAIPTKEGGNILAKVSRLGLDGVVPVYKPSAAAAQQADPARVTPVAQKTAAPAKPPQDTEQLLQHESPVQVQRKGHPVPERRNSDKLISFDNFDEAPTTPAATSASTPSFGHDFLDFSTTTASSSPMTQPSPTAGMDFLAFDSVPHSSTPPLQGQGMGGVSMNRAAPMSGGMSGRGGQGSMGGGGGGGLDGFDAFSQIGSNGGQQYNRGGRR